VTVWNWFPVTREGCNLSIGPGDPAVELIRDFPLP
jgi:hypothetical protein